MNGSSIEQAREAKAALRSDPRLPLGAGIGIGKVGADYVVRVNLREPPPVEAPTKWANGVSIVYEVTPPAHAGGPGAW